MLALDHAVFAVRDLDEAAARWEEGYKLSALPGGTHPRWGTGNRIVPLGETYLELLAVVDHSVGATTALGRALLDLSTDGDRWFALCLRDAHIEATARRLHLDVDVGSRTLPDGSVVRWRSAGIDDPGRTRDLPFFISWDVPPELHPGRALGADGARGIAWVELGADPARFSRWTDGADLPVRFVDGEPGLRAVGVATSDGVTEIR